MCKSVANSKWRMIFWKILNKAHAHLQVRSNYSTNIGWTTLDLQILSHNQTYNSLHNLLRKKSADLDLLPTFLTDPPNPPQACLHKSLDGHLKEEERNTSTYCQWLKETLMCISWDRNYRDVFCSGLTCPSNFNYFNPRVQLQHLHQPCWDNKGRNGPWCKQNHKCGWWSQQLPYFVRMNLPKSCYIIKKNSTSNDYIPSLTL